MKKRVLSTALAVCMTLTLLPTAGLVPSAAAANAATVIQLGDYVQMGTYNGSPILWRCAAFERATGSNNTIDSTDTKTAYEDGYLPLMLSDAILCQKEFDAPGKVKTGSHGWDLDNRRYYGSNYWGDSNIRSWLNSSSSTVSWPCGNPPSSYKSEKGFLTNFSALEKGAMKTVRQRSIVTSHDKASLSGGSEYYAPDRSTYTFDQALGNYNKAYYVWTTETMFLLDVCQAYNAYQSGNIPGTGSEGAWLRTPPFNTGGYAMRIAAGKVNFSDTSLNSVGVCPAFFLDPSAELAGSGTKDDPYTVVEPPPPHSHDMSSACGDTAPIDFDHILTSQDGKLCVDGVAVPSAELPGGNYYLADNVSLADGLTVTGAVNLCLGGMTLDLGNGALETAAVGSLSLCDCGSTGAITSRNADGTILASGPVTLYGGEIGSTGGSAVCLDGGSLALSGDAKLSGTGDKADVGLRNETREQRITLAAPLTNTVPYRIASEGARPFTSGWTAHMGDADFSRYFKSVTVGRFIEKNAGGELTLVDCAITEQPTAANGHTVTANGAPSSYQWYSGGTAVSGQTSNALTDTAPGSYFCRVTWPDGATVDSGAVTIAPPSHSHVWASEWTTNATHHWHECTAEGCGVTENSGKNGYATHREDSGTVTKQPTETETGLKTFSCTVCGYVTRTETLPKIEPTPTPTFGGGSDSLYTLTASAGEGGTVTPSGKINLRQGQWKTLVITPDEGYVIADVLVDGESVGPVKDYTFENVSRRHSFEAKFQKIENQSGWNPFVDVKAGDDCYESVKYVYEKGWMEGTSSTTFEPSGTLTRAMLATALYRAAGSPAVTGALEFPDAKTGVWYSDAILWASQIKLLRGYEDASFRPDIPVSREMMNMVIGRQNGEDPAWTGDPALAVPAARAEVAETLMRYDKK